MLISSLHYCGFSAHKPFSLVIPSIRAALHISLSQVMSTVLLSEHNSYCVVLDSLPLLLHDWVSFCPKKAPLPTGCRESFCPQFPQDTAHQAPLAEMPEPCVKRATIMDMLGWRGWAGPLGCFWVQESLSPSHKLFYAIRDCLSSHHCETQPQQQLLPLLPPSSCRTKGTTKDSSTSELPSFHSPSFLLQLGKNEAKALPK